MKVPLYSYYYSNLEHTQSQLNFNTFYYDLRFETLYRLDHCFTR